MDINKQASFKSIIEAVDFIRKVKDSDKTTRLNFNGLVDIANNQESVSVNWITKEEPEEAV